MRAKWIVSLLAAGALAAAGCSRQESGWEQAADANTVAAYEAYLQKHPGGPRAAEARARIERLRDDADWERARRLDTPEAWQRYLATHPDGRHAALVRDRLTAFVPAAAEGSWSVQLGAFSTEAAAESELARLARAHGAMFHGMKWRVLEPAAGATLWRLRAGPLDETGARQLCADLAARDVACVPAVGGLSP